MLGAGQEVGRSCCVLQYHDKTIVLDAGVHPAHSGMASLPFVDELDWSTVDAILITQCAHLLLQYKLALTADDSFHLDHAAALTYIMEKVKVSIDRSPVLCIQNFLFISDQFQRRQRQGVHDSSNESFA